MSAPTRLELTFRLASASEDHARARALEIATEQTVELPEAALDEDTRARTVGTVERIEPLAKAGYRATLSYDPALAGGELPQTLNLLFGNISLKEGILLERVGWPASLLARFPGPGLGIEGLRRLCSAASDRPLLAVALKPLGLSSAELARRCLALARGGIDIIKDDHGLADQPMAPFDERVARCQEAIAEANAATGGTSLYFPNVTAPAGRMEQRIDRARAAGCSGVLVSPLLVGLDTVRELATDAGLAVLAHPSLTGVFFRPDHGIAPRLLLGQLFRMIGADGVIYPNAGGRFPSFSESTCREIALALREPLGTLRPSFPVPGGGIDVARIRQWIAAYGPDTVFLIGSSLYVQGDLERAAAELRGRL